MGLLNDLDAGIPPRVYDVIITSDINESEIAPRRLLLQDSSTAVVDLLEVTKGWDTNIGIRALETLLLVLKRAKNLCQTTTLSYLNAKY